MKAAVFAVVLAVVGCLTTLTQGQGDTRCVEQLFTDVVDCFGKQGLDLSVQSGQQDATKLMRETQTMDPSVQCSNLPSYKTAINCSLSVLRNCLDTVHMGGTIPQTHKFQQGMDAICAKQDDFDSHCVKSHYPHILTCGEETVKRVVQEQSDSLTMDQIICLSADVNYDCSRLHLQGCDNVTLAIYLEQLNVYQVPSACVNSPPGRPRKNYLESASGASTVWGSALPAAVLALALQPFLH